jgi:hypothetical protein
MCSRSRDSLCMGVRTVVLAILCCASRISSSVMSAMLGSIVVGMQRRKPAVRTYDAGPSMVSRAESTRHAFTYFQCTYAAWFRWKMSPSMPSRKPPRKT